MKELILFTFVALFIACQNPNSHQSLNELPAPNKTESVSQVVLMDDFACQANEEISQTQLDIPSELENSDAPGFYYRAPTLSSQASPKDHGADLICSSETTNSHEDKDSIKATTPTWQVSQAETTCLVQNTDLTCPSL